MICKESLALIPSYLDGELSDAQAAPLRQHLIDCQSCRKAASGEKALKRWFEHDPGSEVEVPPGFASRVARRAFAGDTGEAPIAVGAEPEPSPILRFVLSFAAAAAVLLLALSAWMHTVRLPDSESIRAEPNPKTKEEVLEEISRTNAMTLLKPQLPAPAGLAVEDEGSTEDFQR